MKKMIVLLLCLGLLFAGCSTSKEDSNGWKPLLASDEVIPYAEQAIEILDSYLGFDMSADEATKALDRLVDRVESLDIDSLEILKGTSDYNETDYNIAYNIDFLSIGSIDDRTDKECMMYRDFFRFSIGEKVSGKTYSPKKRISKDNPLSQKLVDSDIPISKAYDDSNGNAKITLFFDYCNGVKVEYIYDYVRKVIRSAERQEILLEDITVWYHCYDQEVFILSIDLSKDPIYGYIYPANNFDGEAIARFNSISDLSVALQAAQDYFGRD